MYATVLMYIHLKRHFQKGTRKTRPCLTGHPIEYFLRISVIFQKVFFLFNAASQEIQKLRKAIKLLCIYLVELEFYNRPPKNQQIFVKKEGGAVAK